GLRGQDRRVVDRRAGNGGVAAVRGEGVAGVRGRDGRPTPGGAEGAVPAAEEEARRAVPVLRREEVDLVSVRQEERGRLARAGQRLPGLAVLGELPLAVADEAGDGDALHGTRVGIAH